MIRAVIVTGAGLIVYWKWDAIYKLLDEIIKHENTATFIMGGTIVGIWLLCLGANWPKKWLFWGWIVYWTLRGFIFG